MKKFLLVLLGVALIFLVGQKIGFPDYFRKDPGSLKNNQPINIPFVEISEKPNRPVIGIHYRIIDKQTAFANKLVEGAYITQVIEGSLADNVNLQEEDIITEIDGRSISGLDEQSIYNLISTLKSGSKVNLKIWRDNKIMDVSVILD